MLKKGEKQVSEECPGHSGQLRPKHNSPSILEGEFARPAQCAVAGNSARTRVLTSPTTRHWQQKAFF
jgi:hypothetical protein